MKRSDLEKLLRSAGCEVKRTTGKHDIWWNPGTRLSTSVPRHKEIKKFTVKAICLGLEIDVPENLS